MPPRLAERVMRWSLSPDDRPAVLGDLQEEFESIVAGGSIAAARRWYWRQAITSAAPNIYRRGRQGYFREFGSPEAREAQRKSRRFSFWLLATGVFMTGASLALRVPLAAGASTVGWGLLLLLFSCFETGRRRRPKPGEGLLAVAILLMWTRAALVGASPLTFIACYAVIQAWPRFLWPVPIRRQPPRLSVLTPVVQFRQVDGSLYSTTTVPAVPMAMDRPTLGRATPATIPTEDVVEGVIPLAPVLTRTFAATESIRVFSVLNANPELVTATIEVRALLGDAVARRVPVTVRLATPKLPPRHPFAMADDDPPRLSKSPVSELDVVVPLAGLAPGRYDLRIVATEGTLTSSQDEEIVVTAPAATS